MNSRRVALVASCGGHLTELRMLAPAYAKFDHFFVIDDVILLSSEMEDCTHFVAHSERDLNSVVAFFQILRLFLQLRPTVILTTGAGVGLLACIAGRFVNAPTIFVETVTRVSRPSLTAKLMQYFARHVLVQWPEMTSLLKKAEYSGRVV